MMVQLVLFPRNLNERQCRAIEVLPLLYASNFLYHLSILAVGNPACVFLRLLVKVKRYYRSRPNLKKISVVQLVQVQLVLFPRNLNVSRGNVERSRYCLFYTLPTFYITVV